VTQTLFFDLGNVIVHVNKERAIREIAKLPGMSLELVQRIALSQAEIEFETGLLNTVDYLDKIHRQFEIPNGITEEKLIRIWQKCFEPIPDVIEIIPILRQQARLILLSNTNDLHIRAVRLKTDILNEFDDLVLSYQVGTRKPDKAIYQKALDVAGQSPENCLFIDDLHENVRAARDVGIRSHQYQNIHELKTFLLEAGLSLR